MIRLLFLAAVAAQTTAPSTPVAAPVEATAQAQPTKGEKPKLICVEREVMGSLFPSRKCATEEQWKAIKSREADRVDRVRDVMSTHNQ